MTAIGIPHSFTWYETRGYLLYGYLDILTVKVGNKKMIFHTSYPGASYLLRRCLNNWSL